MSHSPATASKHVMSNILNRVSSQTLKDLESLLGKYQKMFDQRLAKVKAKAAAKIAPKKGKGKRTPKVTEKQAAASLARTFGREFLDKGWELLKGAEFKSTDHCQCCDQQCPVHPPSADREGRRYINLSGSTCVPWSSMGTKLGWLHSCTIVFLVWLADLVRASPDIIVDECTRNFDQAAMERLLADTYTAQSLTFSPTNMGLPTRRMRKYTIFVRKDNLKFTIDWSADSMQNMAWRELSLTGKLFFRAPASYKKRALQDLSCHTNRPSQIGDRIAEAREVLATGDAKRLCGHLKVASDRRLMFVCANLKQSSTYYKCDAMVPALTTKSALVWGEDLVPVGNSASRVQRPLYGYEQLAAHGYPVLLPASHRLSALLPAMLSFQQVMSQKKKTLSETELRQMTGNGMHLAAVGLAFLQSILGVSKIDENH